MTEVSDPQRDFYTRLLSQHRGRTLKRGDRSKTVRALQLFLREQGHDIKADGIYGKSTEAAVRAWQKSEGLSQDGQAGKLTLTRAREKFTPTPRERPARGPEPLRGGPLGVPTGAPPAPPIGLGGARPTPRARPSFAEVAQAPRSRVVPTGPPAAPPALPDVGLGLSPPAAAAGAPPAPLPPPAPPPSTMASTVPSDLNPEQLGRVREMQGIGPYPPRPDDFIAPNAPDPAFTDPSRQLDVPPPQTRMAEALAGTGPPAPPMPTPTVMEGMPTLTPETAPEIAGMLPLNDVSPQDMDLIMALLRKTQQQPVPGY